METTNEQPDVLWYQGRAYQVSEWLTQKHYADKWGLNTKTVWAMIERGLIAADNVLIVAEWELKLVRDVPPPLTKRGPNAATKG